MNTLNFNSNLKPFFPNFVLNLFNKMKKLIILSICLTRIIYSQWNIQTTFNPAQSLQAIKFYDANTGYTCAPVYGGSFMEIHKTTNAGVNWVDQNAGYTGTRLMSIFILHPDTVFISGNEGLILRTVNGGTNWVTMYSEPTLQLWGIHFVNSFTGYTCGSNGRIMKTTNAGVNWFNQTSPVPNAFSSIFFLNDNTGFISGSAIALKTTNSGDNWINMNAPFFSGFENFREIYFFNENLGLYVSDAGRIVKTTNSGANWTLMTSGTTESLFGVKFIDALTGYACGNNGAIVRTTDGGNNWTAQTSPIIEILTDVWFTSANTGYISTWSGKVLKTTNGGMVPVTPISTEVPKEFSISQNYPNPFNPTTNIRFSIPQVGNGRDRSVQIILYDVLGNVVETLVNDKISPGTYEVTFNASNYSSGIYYYKLIAGGFTDAKKMVLIK
jgi:photosystem II stability/assembly factor-like uncharacterized protein